MFIINPYSFSASAPFDPQAQAFLTAAGIPNNGTVYFPGTPFQRTAAQHSQYVNSLYLSLKGLSARNPAITNFLSILKTLHISAGDNATSMSINVVDPTQYQIIWHGGGWTYGGRGPNGNGTSSYASFGLFPGDLNPNSVTIGTFNGGNTCNTGDSNVTGYDMGSTGPSGAHGWLYAANFQGSLLLTFDDGPVFSSPDNTGCGYYSISSDGSRWRAYTQGLLVYTSPFTQSPWTSGLPEFYVGAVNQNGTPLKFTSREHQCIFTFTRELTAAENLLFYQILYDYNESMGRVYGRILGYGDSITNLDYIARPADYWTYITASSKNCVYENHAVNGTTLEDTVVNKNVIGTPNMFQQLSAVVPYDSRIRALFVNFLTNDVGINVVDYNVTLYTTQWAAICDYLIGTKGYPASIIYAMAGTFVTSVGWGKYPAFTGGLVTVPADTARQMSFISVFQSVGATKGITTIVPYADMAANGGTALLISDELHPNEAGNLRIAVNNVIPVMPLYL